MAVVPSSRRAGAPSLPLVLAVLLSLECGGPPASFAPSAKSAAAAATTDAWSSYGHDPGGSRYSSLAQLDRQNVSRLALAWTYHTGDDATALAGAGKGPRSEFEATPIFVENTLYFPTPFSRVIALDGATGREKWTYDPHVDRYRPKATQPLVSRGVSTWVDTRASERATCRRRIFLGAYDMRLIALDAVTGLPCRDFGNQGEVDLAQGLGEDQRSQVTVSSPPAVIADLVIVGSAIGDNGRIDEPSGMVRAYDARTGALRWIWDPIPRKPGDPARATWAGDSASRTGAANVWSIMSVDEKRDLVFLPTTSPSPDYFGGERAGDNLYASSVVALRASTGERVWSFQTVHHDVWDYDNPSEPVLLEMRRDGREIPAVAQGTKMGFLFLFERDTGKPIFPIEERPVPVDGVTGEALSPSQPFPILPPPLVPQRLTPEDAWGRTAEEREWCRSKLAALRTGGIFTPPTTTGTAEFPGIIGGMHWGGGSFDRKRGLYVTNTNRLPFVVRLIPRDRFDAEANGAKRGVEISPQAGTPFGMTRAMLLSPKMMPCTPPPWGTLTAVDVGAGKIRWEVPLGSLPWLSSEPDASSWGSMNLGGTVLTAGGLVFVGGTLDGFFRAFDVDTGAELWKAELPAAARATPMTYEAAGKQFVVIASGGFSGLTKSGDALVAFSLP